MLTTSLAKLATVRTTSKPVAALHNARLGLPLLLYSHLPPSFMSSFKL